MSQKYHLHFLLWVSAVEQSSEHLHTVSGITQKTLHKASSALGIIHDNQEWINCFQEAILFATEKSLQMLFLTVLLFQSVLNPSKLQNKFKDNIGDNIKYYLEKPNLIHLGIGNSDAHINYYLKKVFQWTTMGLSTTSPPPITMVQPMPLVHFQSTFIPKNSFSHPECLCV